MRVHTPAIAGLLRRARVAFVITAVAALSACSSMYVDGNVKEVPAAQFRKPVAPHPVQVLFEFQNKGTLNARATDLLKAQVTEMVSTSGLFSTVGGEPAPGGAMLSITLNNVPLSNDAAAKGFITGLTFGLAGNSVTDGYVCTAKYFDGTGSQPLTKSANHALHTTIGTGSPPAGAVKAANGEAAIRTVTRDVVSTVLNDLSRDANFK